MSAELVISDIHFHPGGGPLGHGYTTARMTVEGRSITADNLYGSWQTRVNGCRRPILALTALMLEEAASRAALAALA